MAKTSKKKVDHHDIPLRLGPVVVQYLDQMVETGLWGETRGEVVERMICRGIEHAIGAGTVRRCDKRGRR